MGEILASFQVVETLPCTKDKLNISPRGFDKGFEICFRSLLLIPSGPAAFPTESEFRVYSTSCGIVCIDSSERLFQEMNWGELLAFIKNCLARKIVIKQITFVNIFLICCSTFTKWWYCA